DPEGPAPQRNPLRLAMHQDRLAPVHHGSRLRAGEVEVRAGHVGPRIRIVVMAAEVARLGELWIISLRLAAHREAAALRPRLFQVERAPAADVEDKDALRSVLPFLLLPGGMEPLRADGRAEPEIGSGETPGEELGVLRLDVVLLVF